MYSRRPRFAAIVAALALLLPGACKKVIGDTCTANTDCSISADRICDLSQTGGYCTVPGCEPGSCPDNGVCVYFDAHAPRLRRRFCMAGCNGDDDCRTDYQCVHPDPGACIAANMSLNPPREVLDPGEHCNVIPYDPPLPPGTSPNYTGWCVQRR